jgi:hypothetical protein
VPQRVFATPWQKIVASTGALAQSHHQFAQNIQTDVEAPLRDFSLSNREMQGIENVSGNLNSLAKQVDNASKKADRLKDKAGKDVSKVANASSSVEEAQGQWDSQSPFVFEQLQAIDEARLDHLRNVLTQFQTHVIEAVSAGNRGAEEALNALLNVQTADEILAFANRASGTMAASTARERRKSRAEQPPTLAGSSSLAPPVPSIARSASTEDVLSAPAPAPAPTNRNSSCTSSAQRHTDA